MGQAHNAGEGPNIPRGIMFQMNVILGTQGKRPRHLTGDRCGFCGFPLPVTARTPRGHGHFFLTFLNEDRPGSTMFARTCLQATQANQIGRGEHTAPPSHRLPFPGPRPGRQSERNHFLPRSWWAPDPTKTCQPPARHERPHPAGL